MPAGAIGIEKCGIGRVLTDGNLVVPQYQRSYAWAKENVIEFLDDLEQAVRWRGNGGTSWALWSSRFNGTTDKPEVVDGKQRLADGKHTRLGGICDYFKVIGDNRQQDIDDEYLMNRDLRTKDDVQKLQLNER